MVLALSLYAPHIAKLLAYADCSARVVLANADPKLCDCNRIAETDPFPGSNQTDKQKEISLKADWKYTSENTYPSLAALLQIPSEKIFGRHADIMPSNYAGSIFHPPQA